MCVLSVYVLCVLYVYVYVLFIISAINSKRILPEDYWQEAVHFPGLSIHKGKFHYRFTLFW